MKNSRKDGTLVVKTNKPYIMSENGQGVERNIVICHESNHHTEYIAMDLDQALRASLCNMPARESISMSPADKEKQKEDEEKANKYYLNECPSVAEVEENSATVEMVLCMNTVIKVSEIAQKFVGLVNSGLIKMENGKSMPYEIWEKLDLQDKLKIMYCYISFFVNPLQKLAALSLRMGASKDMQGQITKTEMQLESPLLQKEGSVTKSS
jgi:hypothetical protein